MLNLRRLSGPAPVVNLAAAKAHLRVDHSDDDALIQSLAAAATAHLDGPDGVVGRALGLQSWRLTLDEFWTCGPLRIPLPPTKSIDAVGYLDPAGAQQTLDPSKYLTDVGRFGLVELAPGASLPAIRPQPRSITVDFTAGYDAAELPAPLQTAVLIILADLYENRQAQVIAAGKVDVARNPTVDALVAPYRVWSA